MLEPEGPDVPLADVPLPVEDVRPVEEDVAVDVVLEVVDLDVLPAEVAGLPVPAVDVEVEDVPAGRLPPEAVPELPVVRVEPKPDVPGPVPVDEPLVPVPPGFAVVDEVLPVEELLPVAPDAPGLPPTFSAVRSMVTGRFPLAEDEELDDEDDAPGLSVGPDPLPAPPDEDAPPEGFLSVVISTPPEPKPVPRRSLYTPLCEAVLRRKRLLRSATERLPRIRLTPC